MESLYEARTDVLLPSDYNYSLSFITVIPFEIENAVSSIRSINAIAQELGRNYEIIAAYTRSIGNLKETIDSLSSEIPDLIAIQREFSTFGGGKQIAFEESSGKFIIPFNCRISYPLEYADILHGFLKLKIRRLFFSELPLIGRDIILDAGGWRDLNNGEDIDLYTRIAMNYGVFAFPTGIFRENVHHIGEILSIREPTEFPSRGFAADQNAIRDLIIACNYSLSDIRELIMIRRANGYRSRLATFLISYFRSRLYHVRPVVYTKNNLVIFMESVLESLILKEYFRLGIQEDYVNLRIDQVLLDFLLSRSKMFRDMRSSLEYFLRGNH
ncbi:MAG: hypothetical protein QW812_05815 [Thermoplasmataceae archaeon]